MMIALKHALKGRSELTEETRSVIWWGHRGVGSYSVCLGEYGIHVSFGLYDKDFRSKTGSVSVRRKIKDKLTATVAVGSTLSTFAS